MYFLYLDWGFPFVLNKWDRTGQSETYHINPNLTVLSGMTTLFPHSIDFYMCIRWHHRMSGGNNFSNWKIFNHWNPKACIGPHKQIKRLLDCLPQSCILEVFRTIFIFSQVDDAAVFHSCSLWTACWFLSFLWFCHGMQFTTTRSECFPRLWS